MMRPLNRNPISYQWLGRKPISDLIVTLYAHQTTAQIKTKTSLFSKIILDRNTTLEYYSTTQYFFLLELL